MHQELVLEGVKVLVGNLSGGEVLENLGSLLSSSLEAGEGVSGLVEAGDNFR